MIAGLIRDVELTFSARDLPHSDIYDLKRDAVKDLDGGLSTDFIAILADHNRELRCNVVL